MKIRIGWTQEWTSAKRLRETKRLCIREVVRGPFTTPQLLKPRPYVAVSSCHAKNTEETCRIKRYGIPDAWREYLASRGLCGRTEARALQKNLIPRCVRCHATHRLWDELGLPFVQGIPDPWKNRCFPRGRLVERLRRRCIIKKQSARTAFNYDGDDEAEIERDAKRHGQLNENCVYVKTDPSHDNKDSRVSLSKLKTSKKYTDNLGDVKKRIGKQADRLGDQKKGNIGTKAKGIEKNVCNAKSSRQGRTTGSKHVIRKFDQLMHDEKRSLRKHASDSKIKTVQRDPTALDHKSVQTGGVEEEISVIQAEISKIKVEKLRDSCNEDQGLPKTVCCNCTLQNYANENVKCFPGRVDQQEGSDLLNRLILCRECETICRKSRSRKVDLTAKTVDICTPNAGRIPKQKVNVTRDEIYSWTKIKLCACFQKARQRLSGLNGSSRVETKSRILCRRELQLVCCRCDCPRLKIASVRGNSQTERNSGYSGQRNHSRNPATRKRGRHIGRDSKNHRSTCTENKARTSELDLEQPLHSTAIRRSNDPANKKFHKIPKKSGYSLRRKDVTKLNRKNCKEDAGNVQINLHENVGNGETIAILQAKKREHDALMLKSISRYSKTDTDVYVNSDAGMLRQKGKSSKGSRCVECTHRTVCCHRRRRDRKKIKNIIYTSTSNGEENQVKQRSRPDKSFRYHESDSGVFADVSDTIEDVGINVTDHDRSSVTSMTFIRRLREKIPIKRRRCRRREQNHRRPYESRKWNVL